MRCREICESDPGRYFYPDQYSNPANWQAHFESTGPEMVSQTGGQFSHFVAVLGTSGTFTGVSRFLHERLPRVQCVSVQPSSGFHGIEGTKNMEASRIRPKIYDPGLANRNLFIETEEAQWMTRRLARNVMKRSSESENFCRRCTFQGHPQHPAKLPPQPQFRLDRFAASA